MQKILPNIAIKKFVDEILKFEEKLSEDNTYFTNKFSHIDINMMCVFNRLEDLKLGKTKKLVNFIVEILE